LDDESTRDMESMSTARTMPAADDALAAQVQLGAMGRYELRRIVGTGGMGIVFEAYDPELDRTIALKVLRGTSDPDGERRLRREGQVMARLAHPNLIRVYDVGVADGHPFVAMEFIDGGTLGDWIAREPPRPQAVVLDAFLQAGRGLAAAHAVGLVHRDFKPANVLVSAAGRIVVTDFGLARADVEPAPESQPRAPAATPVGSMTRTGEVMGTPAYMAPEQHATAAVDARADQFSFCVALWRALYGVPPYPGTTASELATAIAAGVIAPVPAAVLAAAKVPARIRATLTRGLAPDPAARFPSMHALLAELAPRPSRAVPVAVIAATAVLIAGIVTWGVLASRGAAPDPCPAPTAQLVAAWTPARKAAIRAHLEQVDPATGAARFTAAATALDHATTTWRDTVVAACRATRVDGWQSDSLLDARLRCLGELADDAGAAIDALETAADPSAVVGAVRTASSLTGLARCDDLAALTAAAALPADPAAPTAAREITAESRAIDALRIHGKLDGLVERAAALVARARGLGSDAALATALAIQWRVAESSRQLPQAVEVLRELTEVAARGRDDTEAAYAWARMAQLTGRDLGKPKEALIMASAARAAVARAGDPPAVVTMVATYLADVYAAAGDPERARTELEAARVALDALGAGAPGSPYALRRADVLRSLGNHHRRAGDSAEAAPYMHEAIAAYDRALGPDTVDAALARGELGILLYQTGRDRARGLQLAREALADRSDPRFAELTAFVAEHAAPTAAP
jgi:tetratricopeptide (TPR) repeat protein